MPSATLESCTVAGHAARVQVYVGVGLPGFDIVGCPGGQVRAIRDRVRGALLARGYDWPLLRITVLVSPSGTIWTGMDLPIALGILAATNQLDLPAGVHVGTVALDGTISPWSAALPVKENA